MSLILSILLSVSCVTPQKQKRAESRIMLGSAYLKEGNIPGAIGVLQEATQFNPRSAEAWEKLGLAYYAQNEPDYAEKAFKRSLRISPERAETNNNYALVLLDQQRYDEAIVHFTLATKDLSYRNTAMVLSNLGRTQQLNNQLEDALNTLNYAIRRSPNLCIARFNRGLVLKDLTQNIAALEDFKVVIKLCGESATGAYYQAALLMHPTDAPAACAYLQTVINESLGSSLAIQATQSHTELCQ
jgi:Tfp pilus assembly protein PilF